MASSFMQIQKDILIFCDRKMFSPFCVFLKANSCAIEGEIPIRFDLADSIEYRAFEYKQENFVVSLF